MSYAFSTGRELIALCEKENLTIAEVMIRREAETSEKTRDELVNEMFENLLTMQKSIRFGLEENQQTVTGLAGGNAEKLMAYAEKANMGRDMAQICAAALAVAEVNASMGRIVAAPTAGSCGVVPAILITYERMTNTSENDMVKALFVAAGIGDVIARRASISGARGGCQAEIGASSAMAAGALAWLKSGSSHLITQAAAMALKSLLGLVCDPVAGLVEVPCVKRNASGAMNALCAVDMALAGIESAIPADEVIDAMREIGDLMHKDLRETGKGGLAATATGMAIAEQL